jgi:hypothetical protein
MLIAERVCKAVNPRARYKETGSEIQKFRKVTIHPRRPLAMPRSQWKIEEIAIKKLYFRKV